MINIDFKDIEIMPLGTSSSGGGNPFEVIGYNIIPTKVINDINYSKTIQDSWDNTITDRSSAYTNNTQLVYFPVVDTTYVTNMKGMFSGCTNLTSAFLDVSNVTNLSYLFYSCGNLKDLNLNDWNTSNVTSMSSMFYNCYNLTSLDLTSFNTSTVTSMYCMFYGCSNLTSLDLSSFNTSNVTSMGPMFSGCRSLTSLDLSSFNISNVTSMSSMFSDCRSLTSLDLSSFDTSNVTDMGAMFQGCSGLTTLDLSSFDTSNVTRIKNMFYNCKSIKRIIFSVYSDLSKVQFTSDIWSGYTSMFYGCDNIERIENLDIQNLNTSQYSSDYKVFDKRLPLLRYANFRNLGKNVDASSLDFSPLLNWGVNNDSNTDAKESLIDTLITNSYDRATNGYSTCTVTLAANSKAQLAEVEIAAMTSKGFTIA